ncbi:unnamed protein product [Prunus brigantina]
MWDGIRGVLLAAQISSAWSSRPRGRAFNTESYFWMRCGLCAGVPARSTVRRVRWSVWVEDVWNVAPWYRWWVFGRCSGALLEERRSYDIWGEKNKLLRGRLLVLVLDLLHVVLSLVYIVGALGRRSRLDRTCMVESNQGKHGWVVQSTFGIVKHGGRSWLCICLMFEEGKMLDKTRSFPPINRCRGREEVPSGDRVLLGTNIAPTSLDSSVAAWAEAEWIPRDGPFAFFLSK